MAGNQHAISADLAAAQRQLARLQAISRARRRQAGEPVKGNVSAFRSELSLKQLVHQLPAHLGWGSTAVTRHLRPQCPATHPPVRVESSPHIDDAPQPDATTITLHPSLAVAMLQRSLVTSGRIWLLLRYLDKAGQGWLSVAAARQALAEKSSRLRVCGWRHLRNLLREGEDIFWQRDNNGRIWLRSTAKVARALDVPRLAGRPVSLPVDTLTAAIGTVRAHFYASFHSGRMKETAVGPASNPIARETIARLTQITPRIQRIYEDRTGVRRQANYALGPAVKQSDAHDIYWAHGHAARQWTDRHGRHGLRGARYWVWQLPNSYRGPHAKQSRGAQKRLNRQLTVLSPQGRMGNGQRGGTRRFCGNGRAAATITAHTNQPVYWPAAQTGTSQTWYTCGPIGRK